MDAELYIFSKSDKTLQTWKGCRQKKQPNQFPVDVDFFFLLMFDLEFTFICSKAPRSQCNGCLRHCKPQHSTSGCPRRILPLAKNEQDLTSWPRHPAWCQRGIGVGAEWRTSHFCFGHAPPIFRFDFSINKENCSLCCAPCCQGTFSLKFPAWPRPLSEEIYFLSS